MILDALFIIIVLILLVNLKFYLEDWSTSRKFIKETKSILKDCCKTFDGIVKDNLKAYVDFINNIPAYYNKNPDKLLVKKINLNHEIVNTKYTKRNMISKLESLIKVEKYYRLKLFIKIFICLFLLIAISTVFYLVKLG